MDLKTLCQLPNTASPKPAEIVALLEAEIASTHARLGLPAPAQGVELGHRSWVVAGEQLGVEVRPATIYKLAILDALGARGYAPLFLIEERDVASKSARLRSWALPKSDVGAATEPVFHASPLGGAGRKAPPKEIPLRSTPFDANFEQARLHIFQTYEAVLDGPMRGRVKRLADQLVERMRRFPAGSLAEFGQHQIADVARSMGFDRVMFANMGALEDHWFASGFEAIFSKYSLDALTAGGLVPPDAAVYWGEHRGTCHGRVKVLRDGRAACLSCKTDLDRGAWQPLSLRAGPRMLALRSLGIDLFIAGGTSPYNESVRRFLNARNETYLPIGWRFEPPYVGPHQRASERVREQTDAGEYSFLDAIVSASLDAGESIGFGKASDPLGFAYREMKQRMTATLESTGVHYRAGERRKSSINLAAVSAGNLPGGLTSVQP